MPGPIKIVVLEGDETGQELLEQAVRLLDPDLLELELELERFDLSLEHRRATANRVVSEGGRCDAERRFGRAGARVARGVVVAGIGSVTERSARRAGRAEGLGGESLWGGLGAQGSARRARGRRAEHAAV